MLPPEDPVLPAPGSRPLPAVTWRDRAADLVALVAGRPVAAALVAVAVLGAALVVGPLVRGVASEPSGAPVEASLPMAGSATAADGGRGADAAATATTASTAGLDAAADAEGDAGSVVVHAAGAVAVPGVYELPADSRVDDLVAQAGGLADDADHDRVNLALPLVDGERVYVPRVGEQDLPEAPAPSGTGPGRVEGAPGGEAPGLVDVNTASITELEQLPGVGPVTAQAIVDHREQQGPFAVVEDLLDVQGIGEARLEQLRDLVAL